MESQPPSAIQQAMDQMVFLGLPAWGFYLLAGVLLFAMIALAGIVLGRTGRHPLWALTLIFPGISVIAIWAFAYTRWPKHEDNATQEPEPSS